jgi:hypothetical protein
VQALRQVLIFYGFFGSENTNLLLNPLADLLFSVYPRETPSGKYNGRRVNQKELDDGQPGKLWQIAEFTHCI